MSYTAELIPDAIFTHRTLRRQTAWLTTLQPTLAITMIILDAYTGGRGSCFIRTEPRARFSRGGRGGSRIFARSIEQARLKYAPSPLDLPEASSRFQDTPEVGLASSATSWACLSRIQELSLPVNQPIIHPCCPGLSTGGALKALTVSVASQKNDPSVDHLSSSSSCCLPMIANRWLLLRASG